MKKRTLILFGLFTAVFVFLGLLVDDADAFPGMNCKYRNTCPAYPRCVPCIMASGAVRMLKAFC